MARIIAITDQRGGQIKMNKTDLFKQIAKAISNAARHVDPKVKVTGSKVIAGLGAAKLADDLILDNIPGLKNAMIWTDGKIEKGRQWLLDNTLGKIPGVGPILSDLSRKSTNLRYKVRDALFGANSPEWYEHLPQHVPFMVPGSYNNKSTKFITGNTTKTATPSVATIVFLRNIVTTPYATTSRYSEIYTAVKYARGLSYLPYTVNDMALTFEIGNELTVLYYKIAKAVSAAFHYSLTKANLPTQIIKGLGFTDIISNYYDYMTLLDQMYNFMSVNTPLLPIMHNKLKQMCLFTALDSDAPAMSTYIQASVFLNHIAVKEDKSGFYSNSSKLLTTIDQCREKFLYYMELLTSASGATSQLLNVIADVKGSIQSVAYVENWRNIKFENTFTSDKLFLNSIKNMDLLPTFGIVGSIASTKYGNVCDGYITATQGSFEHPINIEQGKAQSINIRMGGSNPIGLPGFTAEYIACSGSRELKPFSLPIKGQPTPHSIDLTKDEYRFTNRLVSLDGTENTEGKFLEILSLNSVVTKCVLEEPNETTPAYVTLTVDPSLFVGVNIYVANDYGEGEVASLGNILNIPGWDLPDKVYGPVTTWTLVDWMPAIRVTTFVGANQWYTAQLWDVNGIGSISYTSMETAIDYITYSLLYPGDVEALNKLELANKLISSLKSK